MTIMWLVGFTFLNSKQDPTGRIRDQGIQWSVSFRLCFVFGAFFSIRSLRCDGQPAFGRRCISTNEGTSKTGRQALELAVVIEQKTFNIIQALLRSRNSGGPPQKAKRIALARAAVHEALGRTEIVSVSLRRSQDIFNGPVDISLSFLNQ